MVFSTKTTNYIQGQHKSTPYTKEEKNSNTKVIVIIIISVLVLLIALYFGLKYLFIG